MNFNIYNILIIAGIIQGLIFTVIVSFNKKYRARSTLFLVGLIFVYSINILSYILANIGLMSLTKMYNTIFLPLAATIPVFIYFYVVLFIDPSKKIQLKEKLLFLPFIIFLVLTLFFRIQYFLGDNNETLNPYYIKVIHINETFSVLYSIVLLTIAVIKIHLKQKQQEKFNSQIIRSDLKWLFFSISYILFFTFYWAYLVYLNIYTVQEEKVSFYYLWLIVTALIYWLGHIGIYKYGIISERKKIRQYLEKNNPLRTDNTNINLEKSNTTDQYIGMLEKLLVNDKIYLDSNLTLENVSELLHLSPSYLSRIIHNDMKTSFPDYLNSFRIEEAKSYLINPEFSNYTIIAIGLEAGFNSKSSFYNVFKKATGKTPLAYKKEMTSN